MLLHIQMASFVTGHNLPRQNTVVHCVDGCHSLVVFCDFHRHPCHRLFGSMLVMVAHMCFVAILGFVFKERQPLESNRFGIDVF